jgi:hypothetical protein
LKAGGKRYIFYDSKLTEINIWNFSDIHLNSAACAVNKIKRDIQIVADDPNAFWVGGGDYADYISYKDRKRFDPSVISSDISVADLGRLGQMSMERVRDMFLPIKDKCLGLAFGNHEDSYQREAEQQGLHSWLCCEMGGVKLDLGYTCLFDIVFIHAPRCENPLLRWQDAPGEGGSRQQFRFLVSHGSGAAATPSGKLNKLIQYMEIFDADIYMIGHVHDQKGQRLVQVSANQYCTELTEHDRVGLISGSYLKTYAQDVTTYGEKRGYRPTKLGAVTVTIKPYTREIRAEI